MSPLLRASRIYLPDSGRVLLALGLLVLSTAANLVKPWPLALLVDHVVGNRPFPSWLGWASGWEKPVLLSFLAGTILVLHVAQGALSALQSFVSIKIGLRSLARIRNALFQRLQRLSLRFHLGTSQGDLIYRASWDTYAFQTLFQQGLFTFLQALLSLLLMTMVMWQLNRSLTLLCVAFTPLLVLAMKIFGGKMKRRGLAAHQEDSRVTAFFQQSIVALPLVQSYTRERETERQFEGQTRTAYERRLSQHGWEVLYWLAVAIGFGAATAAVTWLGVRQVLEDRLTLGELLIFLAYLAQVYEPLNQLSHVGATVSDAGAGAQRVFEILDSPDEIKESISARPVVWNGLAAHSSTGAGSRQEEPERPRPAATAGPAPLRLRGEVEFDRVGFSYVDSVPVLSEVSFTLKAGESAALVGPSGAGKTTLIQLLPRFFDPTTGSVRLDGVDIRELRLRDLRASISLVLQEPILLPATIAENIAYGRPEASDLEIETAAKAAHAHEFIERLPQGYRTLVGESSARLSTGEKQRITLARAFLKNAPILLLDEPTSALDPVSEDLVVRGMQRLMQNRTSLIVAHRFATIQQVEKLIVLEAGKLTAIGSPQELLERPGYYARVHRGNEP